MSQKAFVINPADNVATAVDSISEGEVKLIGHDGLESVHARESIKFGFKIALRNFEPGDSIIKNNIVIGYAIAAIPMGSMIHLHNMKSDFDERSGGFDNDSGAPREENVYV
jgi:hypothetical protein